MNKIPKAALLVFSLTLLAMPLRTVQGAGGTIAGKVTDPKGAVVAGASVTVTDPLNNQSFTAVTDEQGHYKVEGLNPGTYIVVVVAKGFSDGRRERIKVEDLATVPLDFRLEIAPIEAEVTVPGAPSKRNSDSVYQQLRQQARSTTPSQSAPDFVDFATVRDLTLTRDAATFTFKSGEIYLLAPVAGRMTGAVFIGEGVMTLTPPTQIEKQSLARFTGEASITEEFSQLVLRFTDRTFEDIKASPNATMGKDGSQANHARDLYRDNQTLLRKRLRDNRELRTLADVLAPQRPGYFNAFINGKKHGKLVFLLDPLSIPFVSPEEVSLVSYGDTDGGIWTAFHLADEYRRGTASSSEDHRLYDITHHEIEGAIRGTNITATDRVTLRALVPGRVLPFDLYRSLRISHVLDEQGKELDFIQESKDEDADFAVIMPQGLEAGKTYTVTVQYSGGDALRDSGGGNFILIPRETWYPNNSGTQFGDRAIFDITFRYPRGHLFVATGATVEPDKRDGDVMLTKWSSGKTELAVAGFNYGRFKKKELADKDTGYNIEFYANEEVPDELKQIQHLIERIEDQEGQGSTGTTLGSVSTASMADKAIADAQNATRIYNNFFGKLPYTRIAMTQQPAAFFGQAWPTLVFMPYTAFIDQTQLVQLFGVRGGTDTFWQYVAPHEIAHQWWGHIVGWDSYHDQWMSEGFAEFSASLYVQIVRGNDKFIDFWDNQRQRILESSTFTRGIKPYTIGPVTQGYRLSNAKTGAAYQFLVYPKGAYILHMLRMMMFDPKKGGDAQFQAMMKDFIQTHFNQDVSTEDFKHIVEKHMTKDMDVDGNGKMDWYFDEYVYGTEMPSYRFEYQIADGSLTGRITQSNVSDKFAMRVPVYVDFGKGWSRLGSATLIGNSSIDLPKIPMPKTPKRVAICALDDVLALKIQNSK